MKPISVEELFELYNNTLEKCGIYLLKENDEIIAYNIYEEFDIGIHSFLHSDSLKKFHEKGLISLDKLNKSILLRDQFIQVQNSSEWGIEKFRTSERWREIMVLSDEIKATN